MIPNYPTVSVIIPTYNREQFLCRALKSVLEQSFTDFEVIVVNDGGRDVIDIIDGFNEMRIRYVRHINTKGPAAARNTGLKMAKGKYIAYLDDDDLYYPEHLKILVSTIDQRGFKVVYSDAYRRYEIESQQGIITQKKDIPYSIDFDRDLLLVKNITPTLCVVHEKSCIDECGVFDESLNSHEDWDLWIRFSRKFDFLHLKQITCEFSWRPDGKSMTSTQLHDFVRTREIIYERYKQYADEKPSVKLKQQELLQRLRKQLFMQKAEKKYHPQISIIIPVCNNVELTRQCLMALCENTDYPEYEVIIVDNGSIDATKHFLGCLSGDIKIISNMNNIGFAKACNQGAQAAGGKYLVFLNNDTIPQKGWLTELVTFMEQHPDAGVAGCRLLYPDDTIQHCCAAMRYDRKFFRHPYKFLPKDHPLVNSIREVDAVTAACFITPRKVFFEVGMFDESYLNGCEDMDYCTSVRQRGYKIYYCPTAILYHLESKTPRIQNKDVENFSRYVSKWGTEQIKNEIEIYAEDGFWEKTSCGYKHASNEFVEQWTRELEDAYAKQKIERAKRLQNILKRIYPVTEWHNPNSKAFRKIVKTERLKILFVCHDFPPYRFAGAQLYAKNLAQHINATQGITVDIFHPVFREPIKEEEIRQETYDGLVVHRLFKRPDHYNRQAYYSSRVAELFDNFLKNHHYDLIHIHGLGQLSAAPIEIAHLHGIPIFMTLHDYWFLCDQWHCIPPDQTICSGPDSVEKCTQCFLRHYVPSDRHNDLYTHVFAYKKDRASVLRRQFDLLSRVFSPSRYLRDTFARYGFDNIEVQPLGLVKSNPLLKQNHPGIVFGYAGQLIRRKGVDTLVKAFKQCRRGQCVLRLYGACYDQPYFDAIMQEIQGDPSIVYCGAYTPDDLPRIMSEIDLMVIPSLMENYPLLVQEAFMHRVPVIASAAGGIPEAVRDGANGFLFEPGNVSQLAKLLQKIIDAPDLIASLRKNIPTVKSIEQDANEYAAEYRKSINAMPRKITRKVASLGRNRVLFYFFKNVHIPVMMPVYKKFKQRYPEADIAFGYMQYAPQIRAGFTREELQLLKACGEKMYDVPQEFKPDITFIADSVYPWVQGCGKLIHIGHGVLSKGQYYTDTEMARRENQADIVCVPGTYHENIMKKIIARPVFATGMAKLDPLFSGSLTREGVIEQYGLPGDVRYVLFAPTFNDELSTIPFVEDRIAEVLPDDKTLLIIKLHGSTKKEYRDMYRNLVARDPRVIFADELDITPFLALADVMISDVSSAMMEFAALDKPLVLFNSPRWASYQHYNPSDIEFCWRDIGLQVSDLSEMKEAVAECFADPKRLSEKRQWCTDQLFANKYDGRAAERIVELALESITAAVKGAA